MLAHLPYPTIFAHRGASAYAPENTLAAFELAVRQKADAIELDAKLSADGHVVVIHDQTVDRTTNGAGAVGAMSLSQLRQLDAGVCFDQRFKGEGIPTLDEVFGRIGQQIYINVELTNYASLTDSLPQKVIELVEKHNLVGRVLFSSFNPLALLKVHRFMPGASIGLLTLGKNMGTLARTLFGAALSHQALHPHYHDVTPKLIARTHRRGRKVFAYTVNQAPEMQRLFQMGVDGIFTDDPLLARQILGRG